MLLTLSRLLASPFCPFERGAAAEGFWRTPAAHDAVGLVMPAFLPRPRLLSIGSSSAASPAANRGYLLSQVTPSRISLDRHSALSSASTTGCVALVIPPSPHPCRSRPVIISIAILTIGRP